VQPPARIRPPLKLAVARLLIQGPIPKIGGAMKVAVLNDAHMLTRRRVLRRLAAYLVPLSSPLRAGTPGADTVATGDFLAGLFRDRTGHTLPYRLFVPTAEPKRDLPLVLYLHGIEAVGSDNQRQIRGLDYAGSHVWIEPHLQEFQPCFVLAPQCPRGSLWANLVTRRPTAPLHRTVEVLENLKREHPIDSDRIYVTGQSMGGFGTWALAGEYPALAAAAIPVCGGGSTRYASALARCAVWAFHGTFDPVVPVRESRRMVSAIRKAGGNPLYTEYPWKLHNIWDTTYKNPAVAAWIFLQRRGRRADLSPARTI
jgi:predicted peptidase